MTDAERQWAEVNLFRCDKLRADLSPEACAANRKKPLTGKPMTKAQFDSIPNRRPQYRPTVCEKCIDWERLCGEVYGKRALAGIKENRPEPAETPDEPTWVCARCKKQCGKPAARGLGWGCYARLRDNGGLAAFPRKKRSTKVLATHVATGG